MDMADSEEVWFVMQKIYSRTSAVLSFVERLSSFRGDFL